MSTDDEKMTQIRQAAESLARHQALVDADRKLLFKLIPEVFPERRGEPAIRGRLRAVVDATGWTREYVARIRDGKA